MIKLSSKQKQFVQKHAFNGIFLINLLLGLYSVFFMKRVFLIFSIFLLFSAFREIGFVLSVYNNNAKLTKATIVEKQQKYPYSRKGNKFYLMLQLPNDEIVKYRTTFHHYQKVNEKEQGVMVKGMFISRFYTFNEMEM